MGGISWRREDRGETGHWSFAEEKPLGEESGRFSCNRIWGKIHQVQLGTDFGELSHHSGSGQKVSLDPKGSVEFPWWVLVLFLRADFPAENPREKVASLASPVVWVVVAPSHSGVMGRPGSAVPWAQWAREGFQCPRTGGWHDTPSPCQHHGTSQPPCAGCFPAP